jgi:O-methyltransferase
MQQACYQELARRLPDSRLTFFNYGLAQRGDESWDWVGAEDLPHKYHLNLVRHVLAGVDLSGKRVLEVGCGRGGNCSYLSRYTEAKEIVGLDPAHGNLFLGRRIHQDLDRVRFVGGEAERLGFAAQEFDVVLSLEAAHTHPDFGGFLGEVHRVLKQGGIFCLADLWRLRKLDRDWSERSRLLQESPLTLLSEEDISEGVARASGRDDGLTARLREMAHGENDDLIDAVIRGTKAVQLALVTGSCSYRVWRLLKRRSARSHLPGTEASS